LVAVNVRAEALPMTTDVGLAAIVTTGAKFGATVKVVLAVVLPVVPVAVTV
jgi:hypothetical protein